MKLVTASMCHIRHGSITRKSEFTDGRQWEIVNVTPRMSLLFSSRSASFWFDHVTEGRDVLHAWFENSMLTLLS
jgi:hypothetical protein